MEMSVASSLTTHREDNQEDMSPPKKKIKTSFTSSGGNSSDTTSGFSDGSEDDKVEEKTDYLETLKKKYELKEGVVLLERLRYKEIFVTIPKKGLREVYYVSLYDQEKDSDVEEDAEEEDTEKEEYEDLYEDWRLETIKAIPPSQKKPSFRLKGKRKKKVGKPSHYLITFPSTEDHVFKVNYAYDDLHSILDTLGGGKMTANVLDGYIMRRLEQYQFRYAKTGSDKLKNFQFLSVRFLMVKERDEEPTVVADRKPNSVWYSTLRLRKLRKSVILAPLYVAKHFYLAVFNFPKKTVHVYDSSWHYLPMELRGAQINAILKALLPKAGLVFEEERDIWKVDFRTKSSPQYDEYSCGSYALFYAENVLKCGADPKLMHKLNYSKMQSETVVKLRRKIAKELLRTTATGRKFLEAISD